MDNSQIAKLLSAKEAMNQTKVNEEKLISNMTSDVVNHIASRVFIAIKDASYYIDVTLEEIERCTMPKLTRKRNSIVFDNLIKNVIRILKHNGYIVVQDAKYDLIKISWTNPDLDKVVV